MNIVVLDSYTENLGNPSRDKPGRLGEPTIYDHTPVSGRAVMDVCPNLHFISLLSTGCNMVDCAAANVQAYLAGSPVNVVAP